MPADCVVCAVPPPRYAPKPPKPPREPKTPPVVETLRKAIAWQQELDAGEVASQAEIARRESLTRARVTQVLMLLHLARDIQDRILNMPKSIKPSSISERGLRPITHLDNPSDQVERFQELMRKSE